MTTCARIASPLASCLLLVAVAIGCGGSASHPGDNDGSIGAGGQPGSGGGGGGAPQVDAADDVPRVDSGADTVADGRFDTGGSGGRGTGGAVDGGSGSGGRGTGGSGSGGSGSGGRGTVEPAPGATLVKIDPGVRYQKLEGWGSSICWWGNWIGGWAEDKRNRLVDTIVNPTTGLGYNIFRYNIGGGDDPAHKHMGDHRDMPGFEPTRDTWDWKADARQRAVLTRIVASGQNVIVEAFSNSPPHWMTKSGCASGNTDGSDNLRDDAYDLFADYLTEVTKHYRDTFGITFRTLEPLNEPNAGWWKANGGQEGCHFGATSQQKIIKAVGAKLAAKGLVETTVSASDENSMDDAYKIMGGYDATTLGYLSQMNVHSYAGSQRAGVRNLAKSKSKRLWQSESGPLSVSLSSQIDAALFMAGRIIQDLRELQPNAWIDWQTIDVSMPWTSFIVNDSQQSFTPTKRFYMHAGFSRFIRPGATFVSIDNGDMVAAQSEDGATMTVVVRNGDSAKERRFTFDLTAVPSVGANLEVYRTSAAEDLAQLSPIPIQQWSFTVAVPAYSVTTYVIPLR